VPSLTRSVGLERLHPLESLRDRLLKLARPCARGPASATVHRAAAELALRFAGDSVVHAALKKDAERGFLSPFVDAVVKGHGLPSYRPRSCVCCSSASGSSQTTAPASVMRMWDPRADPEEQSLLASPHFMSQQPGRVQILLPCLQARSVISLRGPSMLNPQAAVLP